MLVIAVRKFPFRLWNPLTPTTSPLYMKVVSGALLSFYRDRLVESFALADIRLTVVTAGNNPQFLTWLPRGLNGSSYTIYGMGPTTLTATIPGQFATEGLSDFASLYASMLNRILSSSGYGVNPVIARS